MFNLNFCSGYNIPDTLRKCRDINAKTNKEPFIKVALGQFSSH